jgi:ATP-dependent Lon protease
MPKRPNRGNPRERKASADLTDDDRQKKRPNRRPSEEVVWVIDTTLTKPGGGDESDSDSTYEPDETSGDDECERILSEIIRDAVELKAKRKVSIDDQPAIDLTKKEKAYYDKLSPERKKELNHHMKSLKEFGAEDEVPLKFRVITLPISDYVKTSVLKKVEAIDDDSSESYKLKNWVDAFLRIPFGKQIPLPVTLTDGKAKCSQFMKDSKTTLDKAVYGMTTAKTQIMQSLAQWIANPTAIGNVIALQGPPGIGKTSIARNGIAQALHRPFEFFSLGGASDIANYIGHSYTYEGSLWGRIAESLMHSKCMNPVLYFDELDKISGTPHGEEVASMLIHLTDRTQNSQFHDRYFAGIDFDMSQCLFVFSFNDINHVNPILRDRMQVIHCAGYSAKDKQCILTDYVWPDLLERLKFEKSDIELTEDAAKFMISEYSSKEEGVRTLIRVAESIITRLNMLRIADEETMKDYKFYIKVDFPLKLNETIIKTLLAETQAKESESWRSMYN